MSELRELSADQLELKWKKLIGKRLLLNSDGVSTFEGCVVETAIADNKRDLYIRIEIYGGDISWTLADRISIVATLPSREY